MSTPDEQKQLDKIDAAVKGKGKKNRKSKRPGKTDLQAAGASDDGEEKAALSSSSLGRLTLTDAAGTDAADGGDMAVMTLHPTTPGSLPPHQPPPPPVTATAAAAAGRQRRKGRRRTRNTDMWKRIGKP